LLVNELPEASDDELKNWLKRSADEGLSVRALKQAIKSRVTDPNPTPLVTTKSFPVTISGDAWLTISTVAINEHSTVEEIASLWLSTYAASDEAVIKFQIARDQISERYRERRRIAGQRLHKMFPGKPFHEV
jgi:hypothetical protein